MERTKPAAVPAELPDVAGRMSRSSLAEQAWKYAYLGRIQPIEAPAEAAGEVDSQGDLEILLPPDTRSRRAVPSPQLAAELPADIALDRTTLSASTAADLTILRRSTSNQLPIPADSNLPQEIQRSATAGGFTGPAARSSQPTLGIQSLAAPQSQLESIMATAVPKRKNQTVAASSVPQLLDPGVARSSNWDTLPSLTDGVVGRSPQQLSKDRLDGEAAVSDVAALTGSGRDIQRAALGLASPPIYQSPIEPQTPIQAADSLNNDLVSSESTEGEIQQTQENRINTGSHGRSPSAEQLLKPADATTVRRTRSGQRTIATPRSDQDPQMPESSLSNTVQNPLELNSPENLGSLSTIATDTPNSLLAGRLRSAPESRLPSLNELQLQRSPVGGPLGPTANASVAKPAFQQRLDRLNSIPSPEQAASGPQTEIAIERGLEFLARYQRTDGSWRLQDFDTEVLIRSDTAATGLALLAFQGAGYTHLQSKYAKQLDRAIQFLASHQKEDGDLYIPQDPASDQNAWLYSHSIAALALCEAFGMTQDQRLRPVAQRAVDFMILAQDQRRGGWRYRPGTGSDTSVTGWFMMALKSGHLAGLTIPQATFENLHEFLSNAQLGPSQPYLFRYNPYAPDTIEQRHGLRPTAVMTSVGLLMRLYLGWHRDQAEMQDGAKFLLEHLPQHGSASQTLRDTYYWYYATQVIFHVGGDHWQRWHEALYPLLVEHQELEGPYKGSWSSLKPVPDLWARYGGRLYVTTMNLLSLEVSYRHLPLYEATSPSGPGK